MHGGEASRVWMRGASLRSARLTATWWAPDPRVIEDGKKAVDAAMLAIDRAEEDANNRQLSEHTALMDELCGTNLVFNCTSLRWYRPVRPARCVCRVRRLSS